MVEGRGSKNKVSAFRIHHSAFGIKNDRAPLLDSSIQPPPTVRGSSQVDLRHPENVGVPLLPSGPGGVNLPPSHRAQPSSPTSATYGCFSPPHRGIQPCYSGLQVTPRKRGAQGTATSPSSTAMGKLTADSIFVQNFVQNFVDNAAGRLERPAAGQLAKPLRSVGPPLLPRRSPAKADAEAVWRPFARGASNRRAASVRPTGALLPGRSSGRSSR
jgi:hypothetical protein